MKIDLWFTIFLLEFFHCEQSHRPSNGGVGEIELLFVASSFSVDRPQGLQQRDRLDVLFEEWEMSCLCPVRGRKCSAPCQMIAGFLREFGERRVWKSFNEDVRYKSCFSQRIGALYVPT